MSFREAVHVLAKDMSEAVLGSNPRMVTGFVILDK